MTLIVSEQLTALALLTDFLFGITCGVFGGAVVGSRRGILLWPTADGLLSAGARVIFNTWTRGYNIDPQVILPGENQAAGRPRGDDGSELTGQEANR
jgi:hypothetical protein